VLIKRWLLVIGMLLAFTGLISQEEHIIRVIFRYGSIPVQGYEKVEYEEIGGLYGGHVSIGIDSLEIGFTNRKKIYLFENTKDNGLYYWEYLKNYENQLLSKKVVVFMVPLSEEQYAKLRNLLMQYIEDAPYDYAFFGMRCASATYDVLSQIGLFKPLPRFQNIVSNFYPKRFRAKMFRLAQENHYTVISHKGRLTRIWEED
jgi:hypothetical protein